MWNELVIVVAATGAGALVASEFYGRRRSLERAERRRRERRPKP